MPNLRPEEPAFLRSIRRAVLATIAPNGRPRQVPICFAVVEIGDRALIYPALDEKPKRGTDPHGLARVQDLIVRPGVSPLCPSATARSMRWPRIIGS